MAESEPSVLRPVVWLGDSRRNIQAFPLGARKLVGDELQLVQFGGMPKDAKQKIEFEKGSGNVFADLGLTDADELYVRAQIGYRCVRDPEK